MAVSKKSRIVIIAAGIVAVVTIVIGAVFYSINASVWERESMTFEKLRPKVAAYQDDHEATKVQWFAQHLAKNGKVIYESTTKYERSDEYVHVSSAVTIVTTTTSDRYALKSRPLVLMKLNSEAIEAHDTADKSLNGGNGYKDYAAYVTQYGQPLRGVVELFSSPTFVYKDGTYYLEETRKVSDIMPHFASDDFSKNVYTKDSRPAKLKVTVDATTNSILSVEATVPLSDLDRPFAAYYGELITLRDISYGSVTIELPNEFKTALPKE